MEITWAFVAIVTFFMMFTVGYTLDCIRAFHKLLHECKRITITWEMKDDTDKTLE